ncbi:MAG: hypothetical protein WC829_02740 [Hyphomicrobium sp.]|jgi:hypothetical protein
MSEINVSATVDVGKNATALLERLASQIGVTVEKVWPWLVKQQVVEAWGGVVTIALVLVVGAALFVGGWRAGKRAERGEDAWIGFCIAGCVVGAIGFFVACRAGALLFAAIVNPEYAALRELMQMVKP